MTFRKSYWLALFLVGFTTATQAGELPGVIRFGLAGGGFGKPAGASLADVALEKGFFDAVFGKDKVKIEFDYLPGNGVANNEALANDNIDFAGTGGLPAVIGLAGGVPAHIVFATPIATSFYLAVHPNADVRAIEDLRGKRIAVQKGNISHYMLDTLLWKHGLTEKDVRILSLTNPDAIAAYTAGGVDVLFGSAAMLTMRDQGLARLIGTTRELPPLDFNIAAFLVSEKFERGYPAAVSGVVKALTMAAYWATQETNREELLRLIAKAGIPYDALKDDYAGPLRDHVAPLLDRAAYHGFETTVKFAGAHKLIRKAVPSEAWIEPQYLTASLKDLHLESYWVERIPTDPALAPP